MARVRTSPAVRVLLYGLVAYVVIMLLLILVRFLRIFPTHNHGSAKTAVVLLVDGPDYALAGLTGNHSPQRRRERGDSQRPLCASVLSASLW